MLKVALLIPNLRLGGAERNIVLLAEVFREKGLEVEIWLTGSDCREITTTITTIGISGRYSSDNRVMSIVNRVRYILANIRRYHPDLLISFLESSNIPSLMAGIYSGTPTIVSVRGNPQRFNWFYRIMAFLLYRQARAVVLPSAEVADYLARRYLLKNTAIIPNIQGCDSHLNDADPDKISGPMVAVGRLVPGKRFEDVVIAAEKMQVGSELIIVGDGPERDYLESQASGCSKPIRFAGELPQGEVLRVIKRASVLLSMSISECWPNVIAEALATGTPVVARDCDYGPREMIRDGINGFLVNSPEEIATREDIAAAFTNAATYAAMCSQAKNSALSWSKENISSLWMSQIYGSRT